VGWVVDDLGGEVDVVDPERELVTGADGEDGSVQVPGRDVVLQVSELKKSERGISVEGSRCGLVMVR
jgi:hypothetical protein